MTNDCMLGMFFISLVFMYHNSPPDWYVYQLYQGFPRCLRDSQGAGCLNLGWQWQHPWGSHYHEAHHRAEGTHCCIKGWHWFAPRGFGLPGMLSLGEFMAWNDSLSKMPSMTLSDSYQWWQRKVPVPYSLRETKMTDQPKRLGWRWLTVDMNLVLGLKECWCFNTFFIPRGRFDTGTFDNIWWDGNFGHPKGF